MHGVGDRQAFAVLPNQVLNWVSFRGGQRPLTYEL
jgi:hypothetical protein